jgi:beta-galactosidase
VDNGNAATTEPFHADYRKAFSGMALLIIRSRDQAGTVEVTATSEGLEKAATSIRSGPPPIRSTELQ